MNTVGNGDFISPVMDCRESMNWWLSTLLILSHVNVLDD